MIMTINNNIGMSNPNMGFSGPMAYGPPAMQTMGMQNLQSSLGNPLSNPAMLSAMPASNLFPGATSGTTVINNYNSFGGSPLGASPFMPQSFPPMMANSPTIINNFSGMGASPFAAQAFPMANMMSNPSSFSGMGASPFSAQASPMAGMMNNLSNLGPSPFGMQSFPTSGAPIVINNYTGDLGNISFANDSSWVSPPVMHSTPGHSHPTESKAEHRQHSLENKLDLLSGRLERQEKHPEVQVHTDRADRYLETASTQLKRADVALEDGNLDRVSTLQNRAKDSLKTASMELNYGGREIHAAHHLNSGWS